jgi:hypothetical protein
LGLAARTITVTVFVHLVNTISGGLETGNEHLHDASSAVAATRSVQTGNVGDASRLAGVS